MKAAELYTHTHTHTHTHLRRCLAVLLFAILPYNSFATTACVENDTVAVVLDPSNASNDGDSSYDINNMTWRASYNGSTYYGGAACLSVSGTWWKTENNLIDNGQSVNGGETNGIYCWCRITYPVVSGWIYNGNGAPYINGENCRTYNSASWTTGWGSCTQSCAGRFAAKSNFNMRANLFNSVTQ